MVIRTFYWHVRVMGAAERVARRLASRPAGLRFKVGNAGDVFARDLIDHVYGEPHRLVREQGNRLLLIGSIAHSISDGDVLAGIGTKGEPIRPTTEARVRVLGVRGPLTLDALRSAGHDVSGLRFLGDPGLLVNQMVPPRGAEPGRVVFIPHYRDRSNFWRNPVAGLVTLDVDDHPLRLARQIQRAEFVFASSLHGLIFAHSLGRPCLPVVAASESWIKYEDHYLALGSNVPRPIDDIHHWRTAMLPNSPLDIPTADNFMLPSLEELRGWSITEKR